MALEYLACTIRPSSPQFADLVLELWREYEAGETRASQLVQQVDKLECMDQAIIYEERSGLDLGEFMSLKSQITLPELTPWLQMRLQDYQNLKLRRRMDFTVVFICGITDQSWILTQAEQFLGGPGVGKGTQCTLIAKEFEFCHISVGELLREEAKSPISPYKDFIPKSIEKSVLLPAQLTTQLLKQKMWKAPVEGRRRFLVDGFPRNIPQATDFQTKACS